MPEGPALLSPALPIPGKQPPALSPAFHHLYLMAPGSPWHSVCILPCQKGERSSFRLSFLQVGSPCPLVSPYLTCFLWLVLHATDWYELKEYSLSGRDPGLQMSHWGEGLACEHQASPPT